MNKQKIINDTIIELQGLINTLRGMLDENISDAYRQDFEERCDKAIQSLREIKIDELLR